MGPAVGPTGSRAGEAPSTRAVRIGGWVLVALLAALAAVEAVLSLQWRMVLDTPLLHYMAHRIAEGGAPYRDVWTTDWPGALLFHRLILATVGYGDAPFMAFGLAWLAGILAATWGVLAPFGRRAAAGGCALFALASLAPGPRMVLQRDGVLILPLAVAVWLVARQVLRRDARTAVVGLLFGLAFTIKPHAAIGLPLVLACEWRRPEEPGGGPALARLVALAAAGFAAPLLAVSLWLASTGGWSDFVDMTRHYLPLHVELSGSGRLLEGAARRLDLLLGTARFGDTPGWLIGAAVGSFAWLATGGPDRRRRLTVQLLVGLAFAYLAYVILAGQFWNYHWMPMRWCLASLAALCLADARDAAAEDRAVPEPSVANDGCLRVAPLGALVLTLLAVHPIAPEALIQLRGDALPPPDGGRVDEIAAFLREELREGETVQPIDWATGGLHAALEARAPLATPFMHTYHFYHHVDDPYVQALSRRFLGDLFAEPPRFVIVMHDRRRPSGTGTRADWPELDGWLASEYEPALTGDRWVVLERREPRDE